MIKTVELSLEDAKKMVAGGQALAREKGWRMAIAVVDSGVIRSGPMISGSLWNSRRLRRPSHPGGADGRRAALSIENFGQEGVDGRDVPAAIEGVRGRGYRWPQRGDDIARGHDR